MEDLVNYISYTRSCNPCITALKLFLLFRKRLNLQVTDHSETMSEAASNPVCKQTVSKIHEAADDFLRSLLGRSGLCRTLGTFESEWYGSVQKQVAEGLRTAALPDALEHHRLLQNELQRAREETARLREEVLNAAECFMMVQRDKDFHQLQYRRHLNHKNMLTEDISLLKKHIEHCQLALQQMNNKYQAALKRKMLISIEKDRIQTTKGGKSNQRKPPAR